jgi:hypothetical protein
MNTGKEETMSCNNEYLQALHNNIGNNNRKWEDEIIACYGKPAGPRRSKLVATAAAILIPLVVCVSITAVPFWLFFDPLGFWVPLFAVSLPAYFFIWLDDVIKRIYHRTRNGHGWWTIIKKGFAGGALSGGTGGVTFIWRS